MKTKYPSIPRNFVVMIKGLVAILEATGATLREVTVADLQAMLKGQETEGDEDRVLGAVYRGKHVAFRKAEAERYTRFHDALEDALNLFHKDAAVQKQLEELKWKKNGQSKASVPPAEGGAEPPK